MSVSREEFDQFVQQYGNRLLGYAFGMLGHDLDPENAVHDTLINVWIRRDGIQNIRQYTYSVLRNHCIDLIEKKPIRHVPCIDLDQYEGKTSHNTDDSKDRHEAIFEAIKMLSENDKEVILLKIQENISLEDISKILNISHGAAKRRHARAKCRLKDLCRLHYPNLFLDFQ